MLCRALFGIIPMLLIALFASGAIPISSFMPGRSSAIASEKSGGGGESIAASIGETIGARPDQAIRLQEELRKAEEEMDRREEKRRLRETRPGWSPNEGWGVPGR